MRRILLVTLLISSVFTGHIYRTCDPEWGNDSLWVNKEKGTNFTFCNDGEAPASATYFNAELITLTATGLSHHERLIDGEEATPRNLNQLLSTLGKLPAIQHLALDSADGLPASIDVEQYLADHILINSYKDVYYVILGLDGSNGVRVADQNGNTFTIRRSEIVSEYMGWVLKPLSFLQ